MGVGVVGFKGLAQVRGGICYGVLRLRASIRERLGSFLNFQTPRYGV